MFLARIALAIACSCLLGGCIAISGTSTSQPQSMGPITLTISACADKSPSCDYPANTASIYYFLTNPVPSDDTFPSQMLVGVRLPEGSTPPNALLATLSGGGLLTFARSSSYEAELQALEPAPPGERWWGWLSAQFVYSRLSKQGFTVSFPTTLPPSPDSGPLPSPIRWRPVVGTRWVDPAPPALTTTRPVECGNTNQQLYEGYDERNPSGSSESVVCIDSPTPDAARGFLVAPIVDFGLVGTDLSAPAGSSVTATFLAKRSGVPDFGTTFDLAASGGPPGSTLTLDRSTVPLGGDPTTVVLATVVIPPGTTPGTYPITVTGTAAGKPTRSGTAVLTVPAPAAPPPAAADTVAPVLRSASLSRRRFRVGSKSTPLVAATPAGTVLRVDPSEAVKLTATVERLQKGHRKGSRCSTRVKTGRRCTIVKRAGALTRTLPGGSASIPFSGRLGSRKLAPGSYRLRLVATDAAGNRSAARALPFAIVAR